MDLVRSDCKVHVPCSGPSSSHLLISLSLLLVLIPTEVRCLALGISPLGLPWPESEGPERCMGPVFPGLGGHLVHFPSPFHGRDVPGHLTAGISLCSHHAPDGAGCLHPPCQCSLVSSEVFHYVSLKSLVRVFKWNLFAILSSEESFGYFKEDTQCFLSLLFFMGINNLECLQPLLFS